jgi:hypothetical protein
MSNHGDRHVKPRGSACQTTGIGMSNHGDRHVKPRELRASSMVQGLAHRLVVYPSPVFCSRISLILLGLIRTDVSTDGNCLEPV